MRLHSLCPQLQCLKCKTRVAVQAQGTFKLVKIEVFMNIVRHGVAAFQICLQNKV